MFNTFQKFYTLEELNVVAEIFSKNAIPFEIEYGNQVLANAFIGGVHEPRYLLKIDETNFVKAEATLVASYNVALTEVDTSYYLFSFTNDELKKIVHSVNEWGAYDKALAKKILQEKGVDDSLDNISLETIAKYEPIHISSIVIFFQYVVSILFPYLGIIIGAFTVFAYRTSPNGKRLKMFDTPTIKHGWIIFTIGIIRLLWFAYALFEGFSSDPLQLLNFL